MGLLQLGIRDHHKILLNFFFLRLFGSSVESGSCFAIIMTSIEQKLDLWERHTLTFLELVCFGIPLPKDVM